MKLNETLHENDVIEIAENFAIAKRPTRNVDLEAL